MFKIFDNEILACAFVSWLIAQVLKGLINWRIMHRFDWKRIFGMGGMPSSHTAFFIAVVMMVGFREGLNSTSFALAFAVATVVIYDAMGVRYQTGQQSKVINQILREMLLEGKKLTEERMQELVGHTPLEVLFGAIIGVFVPIIYVSL